MFGLKFWLNLATNPQDYIWIKAYLVKETTKAILIKFDGKQIWLPKAWITVIARRPEGPTKQSQKNPISIKISQFHWAKR